MDKRKIIGAILGILVFVILMLGVTYAYFAWASPEEENTDINLVVTKDIAKLIVYNKGDDNFGGSSPIPSNDFTGGVSTTIEFWKKPDTTKKLYGQLYMEIMDLIDNNTTGTIDSIELTKVLKWQVTSYTCSDTTNFTHISENNYTCNNNDFSDEVKVLEGSGDFINKMKGDKFPITGDLELNPYPTYYKVYLWIDINKITQENNVLIANESVETEISASASDKIGVYSKTAAETIMALSNGNTWESGASGVYGTNCDSLTGYCNEYRYIGANVNNYVRFNNDMYRIIGVFDENSHGVEGKYLVKLISANSMFSSSWGVKNVVDPIYSNIWTSSTGQSKANLNILLNEYFFNSTSISNSYGICKEWTYFDPGTYRKNNLCNDIVGYGIGEKFQKYIQTVTWYLKGYDWIDFTKNELYECERSGSIVIPNCQSAGTSYATKEKIGLIYASDFMYASGYLDSESVDYGYNNNLFVNQNWLYNYEMWTITHSTESKVYDEIIMDECVWHIDYGGLNISTANESKNVYPVLYLTSSVYIATGDGTFDNPYTLYM